MLTATGGNGDSESVWERGWGRGGGSFRKVYLPSADMWSAFRNHTGVVSEWDRIGSG